jgi:hypothetical protein
MAPGLTQPLIEMSTRNVSRGGGGKGGRCVGLTTLPPACADCQNLGALTSWNPLVLSRPVMRLHYRCCNLQLQNCRTPLLLRDRPANHTTVILAQWSDKDTWNMPHHLQGMIRVCNFQTLAHNITQLTAICNIRLPLL